MNLIYFVLEISLYSRHAHEELRRKEKSMSRNVISRRDDANKKSGLPIIRCFCGTEILIIPSIEHMKEAIENHAAKHKRQLKDTKQAKEVEAELIRDFLSTQMFERIIERTQAT